VTIAVSTRPNGAYVPADPDGVEVVVEGITRGYSAGLAAASGSHDTTCKIAMDLAAARSGVRQRRGLIYASSNLSAVLRTTSAHRFGGSIGPPRAL